MNALWNPPGAATNLALPASVEGCVLDVSLSLRPCGLFWTLGLARAMPVWLPQGHWTLVQDKSYAREERVTTKLGGMDGVAGARAFGQSTREWASARQELRLEGCPNIYWTADSWAESVLPKDDDPGLMDRRDALAAAFDARLLPRNHGEEPSPGAPLTAPDILADCARDALSLAAALRASRPMILATMDREAESPALAHWLERSGICCKPLAEGPVRQALRRCLTPALLRSGLAVPIEAGQFRVAGLLLVAPRVLAATLDDSLDWGAASANELREFWDDASAVWWEVP
ncbi:hypothetical protein [Pseudoroseomonas ludipueritiae]|uniref:Uncharacterized protein n=1 Tax=Pseudoroseomonas ludipueritiae TaxID=198093 RepID=A0ABR7R5K3_9PROT|nr:hypothetical protein [Pseudoroseomonas ludipueritiae]MBC9177052.1 hypothetical protein [Pseudoroseomonas ludipueritiae]